MCAATGTPRAAPPCEGDRRPIQALYGMRLPKLIEQLPRLPAPLASPPSPIDMWSGGREPSADPGRLRTRKRLACRLHRRTAASAVVPVTKHTQAGAGRWPWSTPHLWRLAGRARRGLLHATNAQSRHAPYCSTRHRCHGASDIVLSGPGRRAAHALRRPPSLLATQPASQPASLDPFAPPANLCSGGRTRLAPRPRSARRLHAAAGQGGGAGDKCEAWRPPASPRVPAASPRVPARDKGAPPYLRPAWRFPAVAVDTPPLCRPLTGHRPRLPAHVPRPAPPGSLSWRTGGFPPRC